MTASDVRDAYTRAQTSVQGLLSKKGTETPTLSWVADNANLGNWRPATRFRDIWSCERSHGVLTIEKIWIAVNLVARQVLKDQRLASPVRFHEVLIDVDHFWSGFSDESQCPRIT